MSTYKQHLHKIKNVNKNLKIAFISAEFNREYTKSLEKVNESYMNNNWFKHIDKFLVPWAFEIPGFTKKILDTKKYDLIITFWVIIKWDTPHFDYVCSETSRKIMDLTCLYNTPIIFWILTCYEESQVRPRITDTFTISGLNLISEINKIKDNEKS